MDTRVRTNPFPGLRPFMQEEADLFFGRDRQSDELVRRLASKRFLAVVGTSGSGKSSLVRAGLLPSLEGGFMAGAGAHWRIVTMRPQDDPIGFLARAIVDAGVLSNLDLDGPAAEGVVETTLRRSSLGLVEIVRLARLAPQENLLILVDQFEELFRFADLARQRDAGDEAPAFVKLLLQAAQQTAVPLYVVITMRSDFLGDCDRFRGLPEAISESQYLIPRLTRDELQAVITGPIGVRGGRIAPSLVQHLLNHVGDDMDQLPVLQHALMRAWDHWEHHDPDRRPIELSDLEAIGGMAEALSRHADEAFESLATDRDRQIAERLFKCLTEREPDNRETRRPTPLSRIAAIVGADPGDVITVIDTFRAPGRSLLMPPHDVPLADDSAIDISHESLIRQWVRLRAWVEQEADSRATYLRLVEAARLRREGKAGLWGEPDLTYARQWVEREAPNATWAARYAPGFDEAEAFLRDSETAHAAALDQERQRVETERMARERELEQTLVAEAQRQRADEQAAAMARQRRLSWGLAAILVLAIVAAGYGWWQTTRANEETENALIANLNIPDGELVIDALDRLTQTRRVEVEPVVGRIRPSSLKSNLWFALVALALDERAEAARSEWVRAVRVALAEKVNAERGIGPPPSPQDDDNPPIAVAAGHFQMGEGADRHPVTMSTFWIQEHEVTSEEYRRFDSSHPGIGHLPVVDVSWFDAMAYAAWLGGSLPTEAQWEFAARGTEGRTYPWGDEDPTCDHANFGECGSALQPVKVFREQGPPTPAREEGGTPEGVYDLAGNVWEWCRDWYEKEVQPPEPPDERVLRGGSFSDAPDLLRSANRVSFKPEEGYSNIGFRVVWSEDPEPAE